VSRASLVVEGRPLCGESNTPRYDEPTPLTSPPSLLLPGPDPADHPLMQDELIFRPISPALHGHAESVSRDEHGLKSEPELVPSDAGSLALRTLGTASDSRQEALCG
jgi:hypothetical protein